MKTTQAMKPAAQLPKADAIGAGRPWPVGVEWIEAEDAFNFALYSRHATGVTLLCCGDWGYMTLHFFSLHRPYAQGEAFEEFRAMVQAFHEAGKNAHRRRSHNLS